MDEHKRSPILRWVYIATLVVVLGYAPLAINYTWPLFSPGVPRLQDQLNTLINGPTYALGSGSVESVRHDDYVRHRVMLLIHTTLGSIALILAMFQYSTRLRKSRPTVHRWTGRGYLALMTISMLAALVYLTVTPAAKHFIGPAFETQLRGLATFTLGSAWYAFYAIRRNRDVVSHQAWMTYSVAFMMTSPLLRVLWISLQPVIPQHDLLTNTGAAALILGVAAPAGAAFVFMLTQRRAVPPPARSVSAWVYVAIVALAAVGAVAYGAQCMRLPEPVPHTVAAFHLVPVAIVMAITLIGVRNARVRGDGGREKQWRVLLLGFATASVATNLYSLIIPPTFTVADGVLAGGMDGSVITITIALAVVVRSAARAGTPLSTSAPVR